MAEVLKIRLNDTVVGTITNAPYDRNIFAFEDSYLQDPLAPVLSLGYYDVEKNLIATPQQQTTKLPPFFSNLLPEGVLREFVAAKAGVNGKQEFFLLWLLGADLPGAIVVEDANGRALPPKSIEGDRARELPQREVMRFSLAGVQLKFSAAGNSKGLTIPIEGVGGSWIVKLPDQRFKGVPENEFSMMTLAREIGIDAPEFGLVPTKDIAGLPEPWNKESASSFYIKRFDRDKGKRIHIEDFNQIYSQFPHKKYDNYSYTNLAETIWQLMGDKALEEFVRRLIFTALIGNGDMHLKNWSVIYPDGRTPHLSPAYDMVSTISYIPDWRIGLSIAREKDVRKLDRALLTRFINRGRLPEKPVIDIALETSEHFLEIWQQHKKSLTLPVTTIEAIDQRIGEIPLLKEL